MGSTAYGTATDTSDIDVYGFCMPEVCTMFPHLAGYINGFDKPKGFDQWQQHHCNDISTGKEYDFAIYSIVKYFKLVMDNNPNMIDSLFLPRNCILHSTDISEYLRENRTSFLHKGGWSKFKGYSYSQLKKIQTKSPIVGSKKYNSFMKNGYDSKNAMHLVRLLLEIEQIMVEHTLDLRKNKEQLKSIRNGEWTLEEIISYATKKERSLEEVYLKCKLPSGPDVVKVKKILINCLEMHYGSLDNFLKVEKSSSDLILDKIRKVLN